MISSLNALYTFHLGRALTMDEDAVVKSVPGFMRPRMKLVAPYNGVWLAQRMLDAWRVPYSVESPDVYHPRPWSPEGAGELARAVLDTDACSWLVTGTGGGGTFQLAPFQLGALWFARERGGAFWHMSPGSGKTVCALVFSALTSQYGPDLVVTKNPVTEQYRRAAERFLDCRAMELKAPSKAPVRNGERMPTTAQIGEHLEACKAANKRAVVIVGWGSLRILVEHLLTVYWRTVTFDESQMAKDRHRYEYVSGKDGVPLPTASCAAWQIANHVPHRIAMTGTAMHDRRRDLYGQLSLVETLAWGKPNGGAFVTRYCDAKPREGGRGIDDTGQSNDEELRYRMSFAMLHVPKSVSHAELPPLRIESRVVKGHEQDRPSPGFAREMTAMARRAGKGERSASQALRELQLQEAATRKRTVALHLIAETIEPEPGETKGKIVVFTGRHKDCHELTERVKRKFPEVQVWSTVRQKTEVGAASGEGDEENIGDEENAGFALLSKVERADMAEAYERHPGPCVFVATGQATGTGIDGLQDSDLMLLVMLPYVPGDFVQWLGRMQRHGMKRPCRVVALTAEGTADERALSILTTKMPDMEDMGGQDELAGLHDALMRLDQMDALLDSIVAKMKLIPVECDGREWALYLGAES